MNILQICITSVQGVAKNIRIPDGGTKTMPERNWKKELKSAIEQGQIDVDLVDIFDVMTDCEFSFELPEADKGRPYGLFFHSATKGKLPIVKFLVENSFVNPDFKDSKGHTALDYAQKTRRYEVIHYLIQASSSVK
jgi:hypothetical protein